MAADKKIMKTPADNEKRTYSVQEIADILQISRSMASIVKRGKSYSVVYDQGTGKKHQQVWKSGLSYSTAKKQEGPD